MKKVALVFVLAVLLPSLVLAWLAVRSLRDQQFLLERQQSLLDQRATDTLAQNISDYLSQRQQEFSAQVESLVANQDAQTVAAQFDDEIRQRWPLAEVGFCVTLSGKILSPPPNARPEAQMFRLDNSDFLGNLEAVEVYWNANFASANGAQNFNRAQSQSFALKNSSGGSFSGGAGGNGLNNPSRSPAGEVMAMNGVVVNAPTPNANTAEQRAMAKDEIKLSDAPVAAAAPQSSLAFDATEKQMSQRKIETDGSDALTLSPPQKTLDTLAGQQKQPQQEVTFATSTAQSEIAEQQPLQNSFNYKAAQNRAVSPQSGYYQLTDKLANSTDQQQQNLSKVVPAEAEFSQLIGNQTDGMLARFLQNKLKLMFWHRLSSEPDLIFGAQLNLDRVVDGLRDLVQPEPALQNEICLALLDDNAKPVAISRANFQASWKRPFVATEIGDALPHWEVAAYLVNPAALTQAAHTAELTLGLLIAVLVLAIGVGSWLIVSSLNSELKLARQKTDFVSNVSHELKTPLTSIRMFSELLAEGRVDDSAKRKTYLNIITAEAARLTRLINNVLDFSRMERGEKKYNFAQCDLTEIARAACETFRPHLEAGGFKFICELPSASISIRGDADALSQIIVNLLSNAEKYSNGGKEIAIHVTQKQSPLPHAEIKVLDRGSGVPRGSEEKVFEKFYRAHDSLGSGIQGSGLGLTIARQIARAHGGDVICEPRDGGGSCFVLRLPVKS